MTTFVLSHDNVGQAYQVTGECYVHLSDHGHDLMQRNSTIMQCGWTGLYNQLLRLLPGMEKMSHAHLSSDPDRVFQHT